MAQTDCRHFNGYKPCGKNERCEHDCAHFSPVKTRILIIHLEALGAVLRSTSLLKAVRRKYPGAHVTWITKAPAQTLLAHLADIDRVLTLALDDLLALSTLSFDLALVIDKSLTAAGLLRHTSVAEVRGFVALPSGTIIPANPEADELWRLGLSDELKFFANQKSEQRLVHEALALGEYRTDEYQVKLNGEETNAVRQRRGEWSPRGRPILGLNTGCSSTLPHKKLSVAGHRRLLERILAHPDLRDCPIVLLGGPEDTERNAEIAHGLPVIASPTTRGLRDGLVSVAACDLVFTGDSLGLHMAIGLKKWVIAWFGPTVAAEIELYGRGRKILTQAPCSPCWKRVCHQSNMCYDQVDFAAAVSAINEGLQWLTFVFQTAFPGDLFLSIPLLKRIKKWDPSTALVLACRPGLGGFFIGSGLVDEVIEIDKHDIKGRRAAMSQLRKRQWDTIFVPHESPRTAWWIWGLRAQGEKVGFRKWWNFPVFSQRVVKPMPYPDAIRQLSLLGPLDKELAGKLKGPEAESLRNPVTQASPLDLRSYLIPEWASMTLKNGEHRFGGGRRVFLAPGSVWPTKRWTAQGFEQLARLLQTRGYHVELVGSPQEKALCDEIANRVNLINHAGKTSLRGLVELFTEPEAAALVCNDSGAMHAAAVVGLPTVAIFGPTVLAQGFRPWQERSIVVQRELKCRPCGRHGAKVCPIGTHECMTGISAQQVLAAVTALIADTL